MPNFPADLAILRRLIWPDYHLSRAEGAAIREAIKASGVSDKTVRRDLDSMHELSPVEYWEVTEFGERRWRYADRRKRVFASWLGG